jgi:hypothetical protein
MEFPIYMTIVLKKNGKGTHPIHVQSNSKYVPIFQCLVHFQIQSLSAPPFFFILFVRNV